MKEHLSTPNTFVLTPLLTPGIHTLTICVNNTLKYPMDQWNHGTTEYTQTNWNGITGDISLYAKEKAHIRQINVYPALRSACRKFGFEYLSFRLRSNWLLSRINKV